MRFWQSAVLCAILVIALTAGSGVRLVSADPSNDHGCYCHNNGIGVWFNETDSGLFPPVVVNGSTSFVLNVTSVNVQASGVVPGLQEWMSNMTDNQKFTFKPQSVLANSSENLNTASGAITAFYTITAPAQGGNYILTLFAQGASLQITVQVSGPQAASSTSSTPPLPSSSPTTSAAPPPSTSSASTAATTSSAETSSSATTMGLDEVSALGSLVLAAGLMGFVVIASYFASRHHS